MTWLWVINERVHNVQMMQLGSFQFGISTAAYQDLSRYSEWTWAAQTRFGQEPQLQYAGRGSESITLTGVILPEWRGGLGQLDALREQASTKEPLLLIDGRGVLMGKWVVEKIDEKQSTFLSMGAPRRVEFTVSLKCYERIATAQYTTSPMTSSALSGAAGQGISSLLGMAPSVADKVGGMNAVMTGAMAGLRSAGINLASISTGGADFGQGRLQGSMGELSNSLLSNQAQLKRLPNAQTATLVARAIANQSDVTGALASATQVAIRSDGNASNPALKVASCGADILKLCKSIGAAAGRYA